MSAAQPQHADACGVCDPSLPCWYVGASECAKQPGQAVAPAPAGYGVGIDGGRRVKVEAVVEFRRADGSLIRTDTAVGHVSMPTQPEDKNK